MHQTKAIVFDCFGVLYHHSAINPEVVALIKELRETGKYKIGMVSNIGRDTLQSILDDHEVGRLFDAILASSETVHVKPQREIFEVMADRLDAPFEQWYFIDDGAGNVAAANSYGIPSHLFASAAELRADLQQHGIL